MGIKIDGIDIIVFVYLSIFKIFIDVITAAIVLIVYNLYLSKCDTSYSIFLKNRYFLSIPFRRLPRFYAKTVATLPNNFSAKVINMSLELVDVEDLLPCVYL